MDAGIYFLMTMGLILGVIGIVYYNAKKYPVKYNKKLPKPVPVPVPQGPRPPEGLPEGPQGRPPTMHVGPAYVSGRMKVESRAALELIRENLGPDDLRSLSESFARKGWPNPDWDRLYGLAADFLGANRWWWKTVVSEAEIDSNVVDTLRHEQREQNIAAMLGGYPNRVAPGQDRDEAMAVLRYFLKYLRDDRVDAGRAYSVAFVALDNKVKKQEATGPGGHP